MLALLALSWFAWKLVQIDTKVEQIHATKLAKVLNRKPEIALLALNNTPNYKDPPKVHKTHYSTSCEAYRPILEKYDWNVETMMRIMKDESQCDPLALNDNPKTRDYSVGLLMINLFGKNKIGRPSEAELYDPVKNIAQGYKQWKGSSYASQWTTY